jgi:hypothetical protein
VPYGGVEYEGRHAQLIDKETLRRAQAVLEAHGAAHERDRKHRHYLKGSFVCGQCGSRLTGCRLPNYPVHEITQAVSEKHAQLKSDRLGTSDAAALQGPRR